MAKSYWKEKWRKGVALGAVALLSFSLACGTLAACGTENDDEDDDNSVASRTDTQLIKNGDFEFYSEMDTELAKKRAFINSPNSWSFTSGSPSSDTQSGIINVSEEQWDEYTASRYRLVPADDAEDADKPTESKAIDDAIAHWDEASVYDRLQFLDYYKKVIDNLGSSSSQKKFFNDYKYSADFEDVEKLRDDLGEKVLTHNAGDENADNEGVLMIHNSRTSDGVRGTGQYYTSSTTVTLKPGTAAMVSLWVKTSELYHYYDDEENPTPVIRDSQQGGAFIGVTNTVGSTTLDQMRIENIRSPYADEKSDYEAHNGWVQYTVFVRGSTFAESSFRLVLGLGVSSSSDRYEAVDGYALFDDVECTIMSSSDFETEIGNYGITPGKGVNYCTLDSKKEDKEFDTVRNDNQKAYALDLYAGFRSVTFGTTGTDVQVAETKELSGTKVYSSLIEDNIGKLEDKSRESIASLTTYGALKTRAQKNGANYNGYLENFFAKDFEGAYPFDGTNNDNKQVVMLLSTNGAAYTATLSNSVFELKKDSYMLVSFFVKTNVRTGKDGASATLIDEGGNKTNISAFDSSTLDKTDIENVNESKYDKEDIYNGWAQCFFFIENTTDRTQTFTLELHYGTTAIASSTRADYSDGYAAFTQFQTQELSKTQYGYAATNSRSVKVSLSDISKDISSFDSASKPTDISQSFASPVNFAGVVSTSNRIDPNGTEENDLPKNVFAGLLRAEYAENYKNAETPWSKALSAIAGGSEMTGHDWWNAIFSDAALAGRVSNQPLVIMNTGDTEATSYGYYLYNTATVTANAYTQISMRVKLSAGATAYFYLNDASSVKDGYGTALAPRMAQVTYWYDDDGNITRIDPASSDYKAKNDILFYLQPNGLYKSADNGDTKYYANLHNYEKDEKQNLVTSDDKTIAYWYHEDNNGNGAYYAYYDKNTDNYSQAVENLPLTATVNGKEESIVRYTAPEKLSDYGAVIKVTGTEETKDTWIDVNFFVHAGNTAKTYRLEVWAGSRDNEVKMPANSYFFFDNYETGDASSLYDTLLKERIATLKRYYNEKMGYTPDMEEYIGADDNLPEEYALYSTFTFYDAPWHLRYDETLDEDNEGNPYGNYTQSTNKEQLVWFVYNNAAGQLSEDELYSYNYYLDYSAYDVTVERDTSSGNDNTDDGHDHDDDGNSDSNIWLILSSVLLVAALLVAIGAIVWRSVASYLRKTGRLVPKNKKKKKEKTKKPVKVEKVEPVEEETQPEEKDPNDPYNE